MPRDPEEALKALVPSALHDPQAPPPQLGYQTILVGVDGTKGSEHALAWAQALADEGSMGRALHVVTVVGPMPSLFDPDEDPDSGMPQTFEAMQKAETKAAERIVHEATQRLKAGGHDATSHVLHDTPVKGISGLAKELGADLVIVGAHAEGTLERLVLGSVSDGVKDQAPCDVLIAKSPPPPGRVLTGTDGSKTAHAAVSRAAALAGVFDAEVEALHVFEIPRLHHPEHGASYYTEFREACEQMAGKAEDVRFGGRVRLHLAMGRAQDELLERAKDPEVGLLVTGTHGRGAFASLILGSVSRKVTHRARCSVLVVRKDDTAAGA